MNVLLVYPPCLEERRNTEDAAAVPIGLFYIGALLREEGFPVEVINGQLLRDRPEAFREAVAAYRPGIVGFSVLQANRWGAIEQARTVKALLPGALTVFGGVGATFLWRHFLDHFEAVDVVVLGEGERPFLGLARWAEGGRDPGTLGDVPGIAFRRAGRPVRTPGPEPVADLDDLPNPARHFVYPHVALTRGCPANCRFCGSPSFWGRRVRSHSAAYFVDQLERLHRRGVSFFYVSDDTFTASKSRVLDVCREIGRRQLDIRWAAISRVDAVDGGILSRMRRAGCIQISYGVESGSPAIRRRLGKTFSDEEVRLAFEETLRHGILPRAYFIYGCPGESPETVAETLALIGRIRPLAAVFYLLDLFPGTELYRDFCRRTGADDDIWLRRIEDIPYFETDPDLTREAVLSYGRQLRSGFYRMLPGFVRSITLVEADGFAPLHADFLSRLAMTFHRGEYRDRPEIPDASAIAAGLYRDALERHPVPRAYLGLGMLHQESGRFAEAETLLASALERFPGHEELTVCLGLVLMNTGRFPEALRRLAPFEDRPAAARLVAECRRRAAP